MDFNLIKEKCSLLSSATGDSAYELMKFFGSLIDSLSDQELNDFFNICDGFLSSATDSRKRSIVFLLTLTKRFDLVKRFVEEDDFLIRESLAKALSKVADESLIDFIDDWLVLESSFRVKKWLLITLKNIGSERSVCLLKNFDPEPELFLEHKKLISSSSNPVDIPLDIVSKVIVRTVSGFETLWLKAHGFKGRSLGEGFILLEEDSSLEDFFSFNDLFELGFFLGSLDDLESDSSLFKGYSFKINYSNELFKEKSLLNKASFILSNKGLFVQKNSLFSLKVFSENLFGLFIKKNSSYKKLLPASIQPVVASCLSLLSPENVGSVLDPCCGAGTLLIEHKKRFLFSRCNGLDKSFDAISLARRNALSNGVNIQFDKGDLSRIPFNDESFDRVICNPPFNKRVKISRPEVFYRSLLKEINRVLIVGGVAIIYTVQKKLLLDSLDILNKKNFRNSFVLEDELRLSLEKIQPSVFLIRKKF